MNMNEIKKFKKTEKNQTVNENFVDHVLFLFPFFISDYFYWFCEFFKIT